jgi:hypothetical protein
MKQERKFRVTVQSQLHILTSDNHESFEGLVNTRSRTGRRCARICAAYSKG